jgi:predicted enzyme related to lactoylglutathione lyase
MSNPIVHIELSATDRAELAQFYGDLFGWEMREWPEMNYTTFSFGNETLGGGFNPVQEGNPAGTTVLYIHCEDIPATMAKIVDKGGAELGPPMEVPGVGTMAFFTDPSGNRMALLKPVPMEG